MHFDVIDGDYVSRVSLHIEGIRHEVNVKHKHKEELWQEAQTFTANGLSETGIDKFLHCVDSILHTTIQARFQRG